MLNNRFEHDDPRDQRAPYRQAAILSEGQLKQVLLHVSRCSNSPYSDELKVLLSFRAGLRACEISQLHVSAMLDAERKIAKEIRVHARATKGHRGRTIPMHPDIRESFKRLRCAHPDAEFVAFSSRYGNVKYQSPNTVTVWFKRVFEEVGFVGCSSHSGRRTFITNLARSAQQHRMTLREIQILAGHKRLDTTQSYIEPAEDMRAFVASLGGSRHWRRGDQSKPITHLERGANNETD